MANTLKIKRSAVPGKVPTTGDLTLGELGLNTYDGRLFTKKDNGTESIVEIGAGGGGGGGSISDGDKGDITVSSLGSVWTIDNGVVTNGKIADLAVSTGKIADLAVTTGKIADLNITTGKIADLNVTTGKIADNAITSSKIADDAVTSSEIAANAVGQSELANLSVTTGKIVDLNVTTAKIADLNITTGKIADLNVTTGKIADTAVTNAKIADTAVTNAKIADGAVDSAKIANDTIVNADINANAAIVDTKLATISTAGKVSGGAITSGEIGGSTSVNTSGNIKTSGGVTLASQSLQQFYDLDNTNYVALRAATNVPANLTWTLPATDGTTDQSLVTNGSGLLSWFSAQPLDATLTALAGLSTSADQLIYSTGSDAFALSSLTSYARTLLDDPDAATMRTTLGLGTIAVQNANNVSITGGTIDGVAVTNGSASNVTITGGTITNTAISNGTVDNTTISRSGFAEWATGIVYTIGDFILAVYESEIRAFKSLTNHTSSGTVFPGNQIIALPSNNFVGDWQEISPLRGTFGQVSFGQDFAFSSSISPPTLTANVNDYNPTGLQTCNFIRLTASANVNLTGLAAPNPSRNQALFICNIGAQFNITFVNESASSTAANRFLLGASKTIQRDEGILLIYDDVSLRWRSQAIQI